MSTTRGIFIGTDSGATTSKVGGVWEDGEIISTKLLQRSTNTHLGTAAVVASWVAAISEFLQLNNLVWDQVKGVGLAIPGPYLSYGILAKSANLPADFVGWNVYADYTSALAAAADRNVPLLMGNDGMLGGVAEAAKVRGAQKCSVLMLAPGSGLGSAFIDRHGLPLEGDTLAGMETAHMPAPLHLLGMKPIPCGCGRTWGCIEPFTTLSGLAVLLTESLTRHPEHELARSTATPREKALSLRGLAQKGDALAQEVFDFQARALGLHVANLTLALDPHFVVIGGGLMDPEATSVAFRERYLRIIRETAGLYIWPVQRDSIQIVAASLGDLSQSIGAALAAMYRQANP